ncbi:MAG: carbohydrate kinase family protein [Candidatus Colwellbacteria bacterium]|nr:carbohydrate kinase family protein [Candidatus Colwellbacteria bacterium]
MKYDFIAIGDTGTDAFIKLVTPSAHIDIDKGKREIAMSFAAKIPYEEVYVIPGVGNSANVAVSAVRLGLTGALVSNIGDDYFGGECLKVFKEERVEAEFIKVHKNAKTNYHYVLWFDDDRTILTKHQKYDREMPEIDEPEWVYLSSLGGDALPWHEELENYFNKHPQINLAFQPGSYQIAASKELGGIYKRAKVVIVNKEEAQTILATDTDDIKKLLEGMKELGSEIAVITDGVKGAYASYNGEDWYMPPYPDPKPPLERTGAGDAFASTFVAALCMGMSVVDALWRAPINSMSVVQYVGAREGLLNKEKLEEYLKNAPKDYEPKRI